MTTLLSLFCSEPILSACHARRNTFSSDYDYLLASDSWDLNVNSAESSKESSVPASSPASKAAPQHRKQAQSARRQPARLRLRGIRFVRRARAKEPVGNVRRAMPSRTVSFATASSPTSYARLASRPADSETEDDDEVQDFRHRRHCGQPLFISDARRCDRSRWLSGNATQSFDATLRRRRSLTEARMNRRAFSLSRMAEWDASARRAQYTRKRPESAAFDEFTSARRPRPRFYNEDELEGRGGRLLRAAVRTPRGWFQDSGTYQAPPRPPKLWRHADSSVCLREYVNDVRPPPRPPKPVQFH
ncbi:hypothetical protein M3Y99_01843400 [Aphelenchoides fujianensis]|nr:hypothetical protein M3Y99_01843400 [Aphelenchoides fujianensis]